MSQPQFVFRGGHPVLDFLNTEILDSDGNRYDLLQSPADFAAWLRVTNVASFEGTIPSGNAATFDDVTLESARRFRAALREVVAAVPESREPGEASRAEFNAVLRIGAGFPQLGILAGAVTKEFQRSNLPAEIPPTLTIAEAALALLTGDDAKRIRRCESETCILYFLDTSKNRSRRWCSMEACGNRHKAAAHYRRQRLVAAGG